MISWQIRFSKSRQIWCSKYSEIKNVTDPSCFPGFVTCGCWARVQSTLFMATTNGFICECHLITKLPFSSANASISMQGVSSVCEPRLRLCICMWALCLPICCAVTGEEIIRSSTGTNNHRLWGSDSAAGAGETRQQREWRKKVESVLIHTTHTTYNPTVKILQI